MNRPLRVALLACVAGVVGSAMSQGLPLCPLAGSFGIPCPGCGLTRATLALLHGDLHTALYFHPLVWLLTPLFLSFMGAVIWQWLRDPTAPRGEPLVHWNGARVTCAALVVLTLTLGVWLARFAGYFGGPAQVTTLYGWLSTR